MGWWSNFFHIIAIGYEITDKVFDGLIAIEYHNERLFYHPKQPIYHALVTFMILGCLVSTARICLYLWKMLCIGDSNVNRIENNEGARYEGGRDEDNRDEGEHNEGIRNEGERNEGERDDGRSCFRLSQIFDFLRRLDRYYQCDVCVHAIKVIIEAFPQSVIAYIALDGCPIKISKWKFLDIGFDIFCIAPYVIFICSMSWWYGCYRVNTRGRYMSFLTALATVFSIPGCVLAFISFVRSAICA